MPRSCSAPYVVAVVGASVLAFFAAGAAIATHLFNRIAGGNQP